MTNYELVKINQGLITFFAKNGICPADVDNIPLYEDYLRMKENNEKMSYIVAVLSEKYHCSERNIYKVVKRLSTQV